MTRTVRDPVLLQITDTHLHAAVDSRMRGVTTQKTLESVLAHVTRDRRWPPDAILATGDLVQDESRAGYERFRTMLEASGKPVLCIPGNHDDPMLMDEMLSAAPFQFCGERELGTWSILLLNTFLRGADAGELGPQRLAELAERLVAHRDRHVLICMHHHTLPMGSAWLDGVALRDAPAFLDVVDANSNVRAVLWGHVHQASDRLRHGVRYLSTPSTCAQFLPASESFALDRRPPGARWLVLHADGSIDTELSWVDTPSK